MNISRELARFVAELKYENIPENVIEVQKRSILDNIAIISGGADGNGCREFVEYAVESAAGGKGEATLLGQGMKLPAVWAAFANASMVMALDLCRRCSRPSAPPPQRASSWGLRKTR